MNPEMQKGLKPAWLWAALCGGMAITGGLLWMLARRGLLGKRKMEAKDFETEAEEFVEQMVGWLPSGRARWVAQTAKWLRMEESGISVLVSLRDRLFGAWEQGRDYGLQKGARDERESLRCRIQDVLEYHAVYLELRDGEEEAAPVVKEIRALAKVFDHYLKPKRKWQAAGGDTKGIFQAPLDSQPDRVASP